MGVLIPAIRAYLSGQGDSISSLRRVQKRIEVAV